MTKFLAYLRQRLSEPSSYAGVGQIILGVGGIATGDIGAGIGLICTGAASILMPEQSKSGG